MKNNLNIYNISKGLLFIIVLTFLFFRYIIYIFENEMYIYMLSVIILISIVAIILYFYKKIKLKSLDINYIRELPKKYSIPVIAFLYNKQFDFEAICMATMLKLEKLGIIQLIETERKIKYHIVNMNNYHQLSEGEKYICDWLIATNKSKYSYKQFLEQVKIELEKTDLFKRVIIGKTIIIVLIICIILFVSQINGLISYEYYTFLTAMGFFAGTYYVMVNNALPNIKFDYTKKGKKEHYNVLGFYNFLKEFTLLSERQIKEYVLWKDYLMFAILFRVNNNYIQTEQLTLLTNYELLKFLDDLGDDR